MESGEARGGEGGSAAAGRSAGARPERPAAMPAFRQVGEKQLPQEVVFMAWSPKRDLIALANRAGEVSECGAARVTGRALSGRRENATSRVQSLGCLCCCLWQNACKLSQALRNSRFF